MQKQYNFLLEEINTTKYKILSKTHNQTKKYICKKNKKRII